VIPLFSRRSFSHTSTSTIETILVKAVDVTQFTSGTLLLRAHSYSITGSATFTVQLKTTAPSIEDPSKDFVINSSLVASATLSSTTAAAPTLIKGDLSSNFGSMLQVSVLITIPSVSTFTGEVSAELVMKD